MTVIASVMAISAFCGEYYTRRIIMNEVENRNQVDVKTQWGASTISNAPFWSAEKRVEKKIPAGDYRIYIRVYPFSVHRYTVTIGKDSAFLDLDTGKENFHHSGYHEMRIKVTEPSDLVKFSCRRLTDKASKSVWYETVITNDRAVVYYPGFRGGTRKSNKLRRLESAEHAPSGNLIPNSGFEEGLNFWMSAPYRLGRTVREFQLNDRKAAHGTVSLDLAGQPVQSDYLGLKPGQEYTLSFYADGPVRATVSCEKMDLNREQLLFTLQNPGGNGKWKRVSGSFKVPGLPISSGRIRIRFAAGKKTARGEKIHIDSIQCEPGKKASDYAPVNGITAGLVSKTFEQIFPLGKKASARFCLYAASGIKTGQAELAVYDYFDRKITEKNISTDSEVTLPSDRAGFFRAVVSVPYSSGGKVRSAFSEFRYNIVHETKPLTEREKSLFGVYLVNAPVPDYGYAESLRKFGFREMNTLGSQVMRWLANTDKKSTQDNVIYKWAAADREIEKLRAAGLNTVCNFHIATGSDYAPPKWALCPPDAPQDSYYEIKGRASGYARVSKKAWLKYLKDYAARYKGKISKYVLEDEVGYYFRSLADYCRFYLDSRAAIRSVDPDTPVFFNAFTQGTQCMKALNEVTGGQAEKHLDGIHAYVESLHWGKASATAQPDFRRFLQKHRIPLVTATCFSSFTRLPAILDENGVPRACRNMEFQPVQYFYDGIIWGNSRCHYFYYGVMPGEDWGCFVFDSAGRINPGLHSYSAANKILGNYRQVRSIDSFPNFRIGIADLEDGRKLAILYSMDGRFYSSDIPGVKKIYDCFGNPVKDAVTGPYPVFFELEKEPDWTKAKFREFLQFRTAFEETANGVMLRLSISGGNISSAFTYWQSTDFKNAYPVTSEREGNAVILRLPLNQPNGHPFTKTIQLPVTTPWGDCFPELKLQYPGSSGK